DFGAVLGGIGFVALLAAGAAEVDSAGFIGHLAGHVGGLAGDRAFGRFGIGERIADLTLILGRVGFVLGFTVMTAEVNLLAFVLDGDVFLGRLAGHRADLLLFGQEGEGLTLGFDLRLILGRVGFIFGNAV